MPSATLSESPSTSSIRFSSPLSATSFAKVFVGSFYKIIRLTGQGRIAPAIIVIYPIGGSIRESALKRQLCPVFNNQPVRFAPAVPVVNYAQHKVSQRSLACPARDRQRRWLNSCIRRPRYCRDPGFLLPQRWGKKDILSRRSWQYQRVSGIRTCLAY